MGDMTLASVRTGPWLKSRTRRAGVIVPASGHGDVERRSYAVKGRTLRESDHPNRTRRL